VDELTSLSATELVTGYRTKVFSPVEVVEALAARIDQQNPFLGAFATLCLERTPKEAIAAERGYATGEHQGGLAGVPIGVKDLFDSDGVVTSYGSPIFARHVPTGDAAAVAAARAAGAILIGKTPRTGKVTSGGSPLA
jgi:aspartyl-tRNA(Asn)/glutamyl-tRNA(Gln) amidotransferase subunit A